MLHPEVRQEVLKEFHRLVKLYPTINIEYKYNAAVKMVRNIQTVTTAEFIRQHEVSL